MNFLHLGGGRHRYYEDEPASRGWVLPLIIAGFVVLLLAVAASAQTNPPTTDNSVSIGWIFTTIWGWVEYAVVAGVTLIVGFAASAYYSVMKRELDAKHREALNSALRTGALNILATAKEPLENLTIEVKSDLVRKVLEYAKLSVPDAIGWFFPAPSLPEANAVLEAKASAALTETAAQLGKVSNDNTPAPLAPAVAAAA